MTFFKYLLKIDIENRSVAYWSTICEDMNNISLKLSTIVYKNILNVSMTMTENDVLNKFPWLAKEKHILIRYGLKIFGIITVLSIVNG